MGEAQQALVDQLLAGDGDGLEPVLHAMPAIELGWALKQSCYDAWHSEPARSRRSATLLGQLSERDDAPELRALAAWTSGIVGLIDGAMEQALVAFDTAHRGWVDLQRGDLAAQTQVPKLMALSTLGRYDEALACGQQALAQFVAHGDERSAGKVESNLGLMLSYVDRHAEAAALHRRAALRFARVRDTQQSVVADINLAFALSWMFDFAEALHIYERARMRAAEHGYPVLEALAHGGIGRLELHRGHYHRALPELALACSRLADAGVAPQQVIAAESALADAYLAVNLLPEALALYDAIVERCDALSVPPEQARALLQRADVLCRLGRSDAAARDLDRSHALHIEQGNAASAAMARLRRAALDMRSQAAPAAAQAAREASAAFRSAGMRGWTLEAEVLAADARAALGEPQAALAIYQRVLAESDGMAQIEITALNGVARAELALGQRGAAEDALERAVQRIEQQRATLPGDEFRTAFAADKEATFDALVGLALGDATAPPTKLWRQMERGRARALRLGAADCEAEGITPVDPDQRASLHWLRDQTRQALGRGDGSEAAALEARALQVEHALLEAHRRGQLERAAARSASTAPVPDEVAHDAATVCAALHDDEALVQYHVLGERLIACVLTTAGVQRMSWSAAGIDERLEGLRFQIDALRHGSSGLAAHTAQLADRATRHLQALYRLCWAPLAGLVGTKTRVTLVAHRALHYLPFCAMHDGDEWLMERHEISVAPSAAAWLACRQASAPRHGSALVVGVGGEGLPHVEAELAEIAQVFGARATVLAGARARSSDIASHLANADVLHMACHGEFRADSPYFSSLALGDGPFTLRDAAALPLSGTSLVTLSACETGLSRIAPGDELVGLVRGFLLAGVPSIVASLWTVDDEATAGLMGRFYRELRVSGRPAQALREAQRAMAVERRHPFYWGAFSVYGRG